MLYNKGGEFIDTQAWIGWVRVCQGGHNYAFDIALGLQEASVALSTPVNLRLVGYELAEKFAAAAEYCESLVDEEGSFRVIIYPLSMQGWLHFRTVESVGREGPEVP